MSLKDEQTRAWIYRVLTAIVPLLIAQGAIEGQTASLWLGLAGAVLGTSLASFNTSTKGPNV